MKKSKVILASVGGVVLVASLALAYMIWSAYSEKTERVEEFDDAVSTAGRLTALPVYPGPAGVKAYKDNAEVYSAWRAEALKAASSGDKKFEPTSPAAFKTFLVEDARRLSDLPGGVDGKLVKSDFPFGFKDYITGGVLPRQEDLARLQREWNDVATVVEGLAGAGVVEVLDVALKAAEAKQPAVDARGRKPKKGEEEDAGPAQDVTRFTVSFLARPAAIVAAANAFVGCERFVVVEDFAFERTKDDLVETIGGDSQKKDDSASGGGRRGRRGRRGRGGDEPAPEAQQEAAEGSGKSGLVTDPLKASPFKVTMTFAVYDFRSAGDAPAAQAAGDEAKEEK